MTTKVAMAFIQGDDRFREHIFGILVEVQMEWEGRYYTRPLCSRRCGILSGTTVGAVRPGDSASRREKQISDGRNSRGCNSRSELDTASERQTGLSLKK